MKTITKLWSIQLLLCVFSAVYASDGNLQGTKSTREAKVAGLSIEQKFPAVPQDVAEVLSSSGENKELNEAGCKKYVGTPLPIAPNKINSVWLVTTPGCGWGAHTGPIWLVERSPQKGRVIFSGGGIGFDVLESAHNGYRDIETSDSSAGYYSDEHYKFDGTKYVKSASRFIDLSNPDACKLHPDIAACD